LISYLKQFWIFLLVTFSKADRLPSTVQPEEPISRFITDKRHYKQETEHVSQAAFLPSPRTNDTSVYRVKDWTDSKIWWAADNFVTALRTDKRKVMARADTTAERIFEQELNVEAHPTPHPRHANISGWPDDRSSRKSKALELAKNAILHVHPQRN